MALRVFQGNARPYGQFDGYTSSITSFKGGEVATLAAVLLGSDTAASDVEGAAADGYVGTGNKLRPVVTKTLTSGARPLYLADDGSQSTLAGVNSSYGTLFGVVVGGTAGTDATGTAIGPHSAYASGKITLWDGPGMFGVTLDAVDTTASTGLMPTNGALTVGSALYANTSGLLTPNSGAAFESVVLGRFIEFATDNSLVITPNTLVAALNSGGGPQLTKFTQAVFHWYGPTG